MVVETTRSQSEFVGVSSVEREQLRLLYRRSNLCGLKRLSAHLVLVATAAVGVYQTESIQLYIPAAFCWALLESFFSRRYTNAFIARLFGHGG